MLIIFNTSPSPCRVGMLLRIETSLFKCCILFLRLWSIVLLAGTHSPIFGVVYDREKFSLSLISTCLSQVSLLLWTSILS